MKIHIFGVLDADDCSITRDDKTFSVFATRNKGLLFTPSASLELDGGAFDPSESHDQITGIAQAVVDALNKEMGRRAEDQDHD